MNAGYVPETLCLESIAGPLHILFPLVEPGPATIGRMPGNTLHLSHTRVSRKHAALFFHPHRGSGGAAVAVGEWLLSDMGSEHGTWLNGHRLRPGDCVPIEVNDIILIAPWELRVLERLSGLSDALVFETIDDSEVFGPTFKSFESRGSEVLSQHHLMLLLECSEALRSVANEAQLAGIVLDAAVSGTEFPNAAYLKPTQREELLRVIDHRGDVIGCASGPTISRTLIREAAKGCPVSFSRKGGSILSTQSIVELAIKEAVCAPLTLGPAVASFLYLDDREGSRDHGLRAHGADEFVAGVARLAGLALANLLRLDLERRQARIEAEIGAAAEAQQWMFPQRKGHFGTLTYIGESRPGRYVGGDFFDVIPLDETRVAVAIGDVCGKGMPASVLMTASQGFLHSALQQHREPARAVAELNDYICPRRLEGTFLSLWLGVFDIEANALRYVDAGHGYALMVPTDQRFRRLDAGEDLLVGISPDIRYEAQKITLPACSRILLLSDGFIEQTSPDSLRQFGVEGVQACLRNMRPGDDLVAILFRSIEEYAGTSALADDATAVLVEW